MFSIRKQNKATNIREKRFDVLDKAFLIIRPDNLPLYLKPVRAMSPWNCTISGKPIEIGEYTYPCYANPIRLAPTGNCRCLLNEALKKGDSILPEGFIAMRAPTYQECINLDSIKSSRAQVRMIMEQSAKKLLTKTAKAIKAK